MVPSVLWQETAFGADEPSLKILATFRFAKNLRNPIPCRVLVVVVDLDVESKLWTWWNLSAQSLDSVDRKRNKKKKCSSFIPVMSPTPQCVSLS